MESSVPGTARRTLICSVVFIDIVDYSKKTVAKQLAIKSWFNELLGQALASTASEDRLILDTGDGAAICFPGDPEEALFTANGVSQEDFDKTFNSFGVNSQVNQGIAVAKSARVTGTPALMVNGKYHISGRSAGGQAEMLKIADFLIQKERAASGS